MSAASDAAAPEPKTDDEAEWVLLLPNHDAQWQYEMSIETELTYPQQDGVRNFTTHMPAHQRELEDAYTRWRLFAGPAEHVVSVVYQGRPYPITVDFRSMTQKTTSIGGRSTVRNVQRLVRQ